MRIVGLHWVGAAVLVVLSGVAWGQSPFTPGGPTVTLSVTGTTSRVAIPGGASNKSIRVYNSGTVPVFLACGDVSVVATVAAGMPVGAGVTEVVGCNQSYVAGISGGTAATVYLTGGSGGFGPSKGTLQLVPVGVASLPVCNAAAEGTFGAVNNANSTTYNAVAAGGGTNHMAVYCNATSWVLH